VLSPKKLYSFWITEGQAAGLKAVQRVRDLSASEQIRRALDDWLDKNGVTHHKTERRRPGSRKRS
jgi:hypothetical protein